MSDASPAFGFQNADDHARLRDAFLRADYSLTGVPKSLGVTTMEELKGLGDPVVERRARAGRPIDAFVRLFLVHASVTVESAERAFAPLSLASLQSAGLLRIVGDHVEPAVEILPLEGYWYVFDMPARKTGRVREDYVMGIGTSSTLVARHAVQRPGGTVLDMGCGAGYLAFELSPAAARIVGVDRNPRAIQMARFNAALADKTNCEFRAGDMFAPVQGQRFDTIVTNPPFVISPEKTFIFRDSGRSGDSIVQEVCGAFGTHLNVGGWSSMVCNWAHLKGVPWQDRVASWFAGHDVDALVITSETRDADLYAWTWVHHTSGDDPAGMPARFEKWAASYEQAGIEAVSAGIIICRKRGDSQRPRVWFEDAPPGASTDKSGALARHLTRLFDNRHAIESLDASSVATDGPRDWLASRPRLADSVVMDHQLTLTHGDASQPSAWTSHRTELVLTAGLGYRFTLDPSVLPIVTLMNGQRTLAAILKESEAAIGQPAARMVPSAVHILKLLMQRGLVELI